MRGWPLRLAVAVLGLAVSAAYAFAQFESWGRFREGSVAPVFPPADFRAPAFTFCRLMYTQVRREPMGMGWRTDYPYAEINFMIRMSELTRAAVTLDAGKQPTHFFVRDLNITRAGIRAVIDGVAAGQAVRFADDFHAFGGTFVAAVEDETVGRHECSRTVVFIACPE